MAYAGLKELTVVDNLNFLSDIKALDVLKIQADSRSRFVVDVGKYLLVLRMKDQGHVGAAFLRKSCPFTEFVYGRTAVVRHEIALCAKSLAGGRVSIGSIGHKSQA
ncbi:MAG: hypothetical protein CMJ50_04215 [Planctomycetaceae bacterium]|nr:hypothetical protein [Planctomycetaceae bacterium]